MDGSLILVSQASEVQRGPGLPVVKCGSCGLVVYPATVGSCPRCTSDSLAEDLVDGDGVIWSWTVQRFAPKSPPYVPPKTGFVPFAVAYVETAEGFRVEAIVETDTPDELNIAQPVRLIGVTDSVPRYRVAGGEDAR